MRRSMRDWLIVAIGVGISFFAATCFGFVAAHATVRPPWIERLSEILALVGAACLAGAVSSVVSLAKKWPGAQPPGAKGPFPGETGVSAHECIRPKISRLALASLVLATPPVVCLWGLPAVVGLILGLVALHDIHASDGHLKGTSLALAGTIISSFVLFMVLFIVLFVGPD